MPCLHTLWPGQLQGPHPPCTRPAPAGQGSYRNHTHHAHGLHPLARAVTRPTPTMHSAWGCSHPVPSAGQPVTLTLPRSLPARGYLGRQPELTPCRAVLPETPRVLHTTPALSPVPYVTEDATSPGTKTLSQGHELGGRQSLKAGGSVPGSCSRPQCHPWAPTLPQASGSRGLWACNLRPQGSFPHL